MLVVVRQSVLLYGVRYAVGLRDIPEGHCCGAEFDAFVADGSLVPQETGAKKPVEKQEEKKEEVTEKKPRSKKAEG